jgi:hypothetical protein
MIDPTTLRARYRADKAALLASLAGDSGASTRGVNAQLHKLSDLADARCARCGNKPACHAVCFAGGGWLWPRRAVSMLRRGCAAAFAQ